jgi:hypothetical protein
LSKRSLVAQVFLDCYILIVKASTDLLIKTGQNGLRGGEIDMAGISTKLEKVTQESSALSVKARPDLFTFSPASLRVYDDDLNAALRARGHPGMQLERPKATKRASKRIGSPSSFPFTSMLYRYKHLFWEDALRQSIAFLSLLPIIDFLP